MCEESSVSECKDWLARQLEDGVVHLCEDIRKRASERGFSKRELKNARIELGVKTYHQFDEDGPAENWFWYLER